MSQEDENKGDRKWVISTLRSCQKESTVSNLVGGMRHREVGLRIFNLRFFERHKLPKGEKEYEDRNNKKLVTF